METNGKKEFFNPIEDDLKEALEKSSYVTHHCLFCGMDYYCPSAKGPLACYRGCPGLMQRKEKEEKINQR